MRTRAVIYQAWRKGIALTTALSLVLSQTSACYAMDRAEEESEGSVSYIRAMPPAVLDTTAQRLEEELFSSMRDLTHQFMALTRAQPLSTASSDHVIVQGRFLTPHVLTQEQARLILGINEYGLPVPKSDLSSFDAQFQIQMATLQEPLPISTCLSHYLFHKLLTGQEGVIPSTILTLQNVQILTPSQGPSMSSSATRSTYLGMQELTYALKPHPFVFMLQPKGHETLKKLLFSNSLEAQNFSPVWTGAMLLSSFLIHPSEVLAEDIVVLQNEEGTPLLYYPPNPLTPSPISFSKASSRHFLDVRNALYQLPEFMDQPIDPLLRAHLSSLDPSVFVLRWLNLLQQEEKHHRRLLKDTGLSQDHQLDLGLPLTLPPGLSDSFLKTISSLQQALKTASSYQNLFETYAPLVAHTYGRLKELFPNTPWQGLDLVKTQQDALTGRILPAQSLEEVLDLTASLANGNHVFEALEEERFPFAGSILIQSLPEAIHKVIEKLQFNTIERKDQLALLSLLGTSFKDQTLNHAQKLKGNFIEPGLLDSFLYDALDQASIELLVALGANVNTKNTQVHSPLYARIHNLKEDEQEKAWPLLETLVQGGVDLLAQPEVGIFEVMLEKNLDVTLTRLLEQATKQWKPYKPLDINPQILLSRYRSWVRAGKQNENLKQAFTLLSQMSPINAWHLALEDVLPLPQSPELTYDTLLSLAQQHLDDEDDRDDIQRMIERKRPLETIKVKLEKLLGRSLSDLQPTGKKLQGIFMGERSLRPEIEAQLFDEQGQVRRSNTHGRRDVARVEYQGRVLYFKHLPELPGFEYAMYRLHEKLIGHGIAPSELVKVGNQTFLVSLGIEGQNLHDVINNTPELLSKIEPRSLSGMMLMTMLTNPEDAKADNFILAPLPFQKDQYQLVSIDNDHSFMPTLARTTEDPRKAVLQVKSILYCLDQMQQSVSQDIQALFHSLDPYKVLKGWLEELNQLDNYEKLFSNEEARSLSTQGCVVSIPFKAQMVAQAYDKMVRLQDMFVPKSTTRSTKSLSHQQVLLQLEPLLGKRYGVGFSKPQSVAERFKLINGRFYKQGDTGAYISTTTSSVLLCSLGLPAEANLINTVRRTGELSITGALEELEAIRLERDRELLGGDRAVEHLKLLKSENARSLYLSRLDFKELGLAQQQALLRVLKDSDPRRLTFKNCIALTLQILLEDIGVGNLTQLVIDNNPTLDDGFIKKLQEHNQALRRLVLHNLPQLITIQAIFPELEYLCVEGCPNLKALSITSPKLRKLIAPHNPTLEKLAVVQPEPTLRLLDLSHNASLKDEMLESLLATQAKLKSLNVKNSLGISFAEIRSADPTYPVELLRALTPEDSKVLLSPIARLLAQDPKFCTLSLQPIGLNAAKALTEVLRHNTTLQKLIVKNIINDEESIEWDKLDPFTLISLVNPENKRARARAARAEWVSQLAEILRENNALKELHLEGNRIGPKGAQALGEALKHNTTLQKLSLPNSHLYITDHSIKTIKTLSSGQFLRRDLLSEMWDSCLGAHGASYLSDALEHNTTLKVLDLSFNLIDRGAMELARALKRNSTLQVLNLSYNFIVPPDSWLFGALKENKALQSLVLKENLINLGEDPGFFESIKYALSHNTTLTKLDLSDNYVDYKQLSLINKLLKSRRSAVASNASPNPQEKGPCRPIYLQGTWESVNFSLLPASITSPDLLDLLALDRGYGVQQLLKAKHVSEYREALAPDIQKAFLKNLFPPAFMHDSYAQALSQEFLSGHKQPDFDQRLQAYVEDPSTYTTYVRFVLGKDTPWQHHFQEASLRLMAQLHGFSYIVWQKDPSSSNLKVLEQVLTQPPLKHVLYSPSPAGDLFGQYELLQEHKVQGSLTFPTTPAFEDETQDIPCPWLTPVVEDASVPATFLFQSSDLQGLSPDLRRLLEPLRVSTPELTCLGLTSNDTHHLAQLLQTNSTLRRLVLPACDMGDEEAQAWARVLEQNKALTFLSFAQNHIQAQGIDALRHALQQNSTLTQLRLTGNPGLNAQTGKAIQDLLSLNQARQYRAYIGKEQPKDISISHMGAPGVRLLLKNLKDMPFLTTLSLQFTPLYEPKTLHRLKEFLSVAPHLKQLILLDTHLTDESLHEIRDSLAYHPQLTLLDLRGNRLQEAGIQALCDLIRQTSSLRHLDVRWNFMEEAKMSTLVEAWRSTNALQTLMMDVREKSPLYQQIGQLRQEHQAAQGLPLTDRGRIQRIQTGFQVTLRGVTQRMKVQEVKGDGNCGYSALKTTREEVAQKLLEQVADPNIRHILGVEIEDNFDLLPPPLKTTTYRDLQKRQQALDVQKQEKIKKLNDALRRPEGDRWSQDKLLKEYFTSQESLKENVIALMQSLIELTLQEEKLMQEKQEFCCHEDTLRLYIQHYIRPSAEEYANQYYPELNWLTFSPQFDHGYYRLGTVGALARVLGCNVAVWNSENLSLAHEYYWNPNASTIHLLFNGRNHFDRLTINTD
ncbi:hypothetical protein [Candidatus Paracaedibacter symbiosus]|uniref:hypothetical protein n=1 Tax=Candidatus Paracaedibacter symbiosus TaxID=244582 RepID=UPI000509E7E2|nr:hypothetical protein [Candidatus Paracaedibacter symbiosus]